MSSSAQKEKDRELRKRYEQILEDANKQPEQTARHLSALRSTILLHGLPRQTSEERLHNDTKCSLRGRVWKALLGIKVVNAERLTFMVVVQ